MPQSEYAGPHKTFPENDKKHARLAIPMAAKSYNAGNISKSTEVSIQAKARKKLGKSGKSSDDRKKAIISNAIKGYQG